MHIQFIHKLNYYFMFHLVNLTKCSDRQSGSVITEVSWENEKNCLGKLYILGRYVKFMLLRSFHTGNIGNIRSFQVDTACSVSLLHMLVCTGCDITALHVSFPRINHDEICHFQEEEAELIVLLVTSIIVFIYPL